VELLGVQFYKDLVGSSMPDTQTKPCTPAEVTQDFLHLAGRRALVPKVFPFSLKMLSQVDATTVHDMEMAKKASAGANVVRFLSHLEGPNIKDMMLLFIEWEPSPYTVQNVIGSSSSSCVDEKEPNVYTSTPWASFVMRTPAGVVPGAQTGLWEGKLLIGTLDHAINDEWLQWAGITHIICCLGTFNDSNGPAIEMTCARDTRFNSILYTDWKPNLTWIKQYHWAVYHDVQCVLKSPCNCVLVYCKSGCDRSMFMVSSFLRLYHYKNIHECKDLLANRQNIHGIPLEQLESWKRQDFMDWLDSAVQERSLQRPSPMATIAWYNGSSSPKKYK